MKFQNSLLLISGVITAVVGHGGVCWYEIDGTIYDGYLWKIEDGSGNALPDPEPIPSIQRRWTFWPNLNTTSPNMTCNYDGLGTPNSLHAPIVAGHNVTAHWDNFMPNVWPDSWHHANGPLLTYLAACPGESCEGFEGSGNVWFKIDQLGLLPEATDLRGPWWQRDLVFADGTVKPGYTVTIPKNLKAGNYLIRTELIMMASRPPQFYPECAQITVTGDGTELPGEEYLVSFPGAYADSDPGLIMSQWYMTEGGTWNGSVPTEWATTDYPFPGPQVWTGESQ